MSRFWSAAGIVLAGLAAAVAVETRADEGFYKIGDTVETLKAADVSGKEVSLADLNGKVVFLNFFAFK